MSGKKTRYTFDFSRCLREDHKYPILNYFRVERHLTRPLAGLIVRAVLNTRITPNQITIFSFIIGLSAGIFLTMGTRQGFIIGGILAWMASIFDCADGMLARLRNTMSAYGAYLDLSLDRITDLILLGGLAVGYFRWSGNLIFFFICMGGIALHFLQVSLYYLTSAYLKRTGLGEMAEIRGLMIFMIFSFLLAGYPRLLIYILLFGTALHTVINVVNLVRLGIKAVARGG